LSKEYDVVHLHTVIVKETTRVGLHGIHEKLIDHQAEAIGYKLIKLYLDSSDDHQAYCELMQQFYQQCTDDGIEGILFGDIFLEDLKDFREQLLRPSGLTGVYPLWKQSTRKLVEEFIDTGFKTLVCAANQQFFTKEDLGKTIDKNFIASLSPSVDPCGENGEFHTFVYDGPIFRYPLQFQLAEIVEKEYEFKMKHQDGDVKTERSSFCFQEVKLN
jgi:uncharacterized protein (TIGR00290 family)